MEPVSLVLDALMAGLSAGGQKVAGDAVSDAYSSFKALLRRRVGGYPAAESAFDRYQTDPAADGSELEMHLRSLGIDHDEEIIQAAQCVLARAEALQSGPKYSVNLESAKGVQVGDDSTQYNQF